MPAGDAGGRDSHANRQHNRRLKATSNICWLCGDTIDLTLPTNHPMAWTADHINSLMTGGDMLGHKLPAHRKCNSSRGATERHQRNKPTHPTSRNW